MPTLTTSLANLALEANALNTSITANNTSITSLSAGSGLFSAANGNVGIGTTSPYARTNILNGSSNLPLFIQGGAGANAGDGGGISFATAINSSITSASNAASAIRSLNVYAGESNGESGALAFYTNQRTGTNTYTGLTEQMRISANGFVGIGTSSPGYLLTVNGTASFGNQLAAANSPNVNLQGAWIGWNASGGTGETNFINQNGAGAGGFTWAQSTTGNSRTEWMRLNSSGQLGIGTSSPGAKLDVSSSGQNIVVSRSTGGFAAFQRFAPSGQQVYDFYTINGAEAARITVDGANFMTFATGSSATERMRIDSSGNLGIGTSSPGYLLDVFGNTRIKAQSSNDAILYMDTSNVGNAAYINFGQNGTLSQAYVGFGGSSYPYLGGNNSLNFWNATSTGPIVFAAGNSQCMRITSSGQVGIGTTSPSYRLSVYTTAADGTDGLNIAGGSTTKNVNIKPSLGSGNYNPITQSGDSGIIFDGGSANSGNLVIAPWSSSTGGIRINSSGQVAIGASSVYNSAPLSTTSNSLGTAASFYFGSNPGSNGYNLVWFGSSAGGAGAIVASSSTVTLASVSDRRLKTNITPLNGALANIMAIQPVKFNWLADGLESVGFIADQFQQVFPRSVSGAKDAIDESGKPVYQMLDAGTHEVIATLIAAVQELSAELNALKAKVGVQ